jgi:hypothetical protein
VLPAIATCATCYSDGGRPSPRLPGARAPARPTRCPLAKPAQHSAFSSPGRARARAHWASRRCACSDGRSAPMRPCDAPMCPCATQTRARRRKDADERAGLHRGQDYTEGRTTHRGRLLEEQGAGISRALAHIGRGCIETSIALGGAAATHDGCHESCLLQHMLQHMLQHTRHTSPPAAFNSGLVTLAPHACSPQSARG